MVNFWNASDLQVLVLFKAYKSVRLHEHIFTVFMYCT